MQPRKRVGKLQDKCGTDERPIGTPWYNADDGTLHIRNCAMIEHRRNRHPAAPSDRPSGMFALR
jgi:hypothetical protein